LLARFSAERDETAFAVLVRRHGPMVFGVCRRVLRDRHAAEDALQATFLVLARKAGQLREPGSLAPWLYGVAARVAARARLEAARRRRRERQAGVREAVEPTEDAVWRDLRPVLDEEVDRLPARYRVPFVLCYVAGRTNAEAARQLGCSRGTIATRLARARERLRRRLTGRGVVLSAGLAGALLSERLRAEPLSIALQRATVRAASRFAAGETIAAGAVSARAAFWAEGVARIMLMNKVKIFATGVLAIVFIAVGVGAVRKGTAADGAGAPRGEASQSVPVPAKLVPRAAAPAEDKDTMPYRTANFTVHAPTAEVARQVGRAAEKHRRELALLWLGKDLPDWTAPCRVDVQLSDRDCDSSTTLQFEKHHVIVREIFLRASRDVILADLLPHEVTHAVLAHGRDAPYPRWADEGAAMLAESAASRARHETMVQKILAVGGGLPLRRLLALHEYPKEIMAMYSQGYSLTAFLVGQKGRGTFLAFVARGEREGWDEAVRVHYGYGSVEELEQAWRQNLRQSVPITPAENWAEELFESRSHDFGSVVRGKILTHSFRLVNRTDRPVHIAGVRSSCGCVTAIPTQTSVAPGHGASILVEVDTYRFTGPKSINLYVQIDRPQTAEVHLTVRADSRPEAGGTTPPQVDPKAERRARLKDLEERLERLQKEIESLRREVGPEPSSPQREEGTDVYRTDRRTFKVPFVIGPGARAGMKEVLLFASTDQGRTWQQVASAAPDQDAFTFTAPADGLYWLTVATVDQNGTRSPSDPHGKRPAIKVRVQTRQ
jgi:RNA polymerase sigma factor (sigma-70 family)